MRLTPSPGSSRRQAGFWTADTDWIVGESQPFRSLDYSRLFFLVMAFVPSAFSLGPRRRGVRMSSSQSSVLFVCLGNICRSPTAEAMFKTVVEREGKAATYEIDSCGTGGGNPDWFTEGGWSYHEGDSSDSRMMQTAAKRGIALTSRSRPLNKEDLEKFDRIIGNREELSVAYCFGKTRT
mmetsp:Transcript_45470/g.176813  ORF Transcript_45470/g.176813 Transcript_45470/m.176813 type:complete len:180 (+) Transcript_45470:708-1247(+)